MEKETNNTQAEEVKIATETTEQTLGEITNPTTEEPKTIGLDKFLDIKKENKELRKQIDALANRINSSNDKQDFTTDLDALAEEFDLDKGFIKKLAKSIERKATEELNETIGAKLEPITRQEKAKQFEEAFQKSFDKSLDVMPEYKNLVNKDLIKALATSPLNANKTMSQIIEESYSNQVAGKKSLETTTNNGGKEPETLNYDKAKKDSEYFDEIMNNPKLKEEYNKKHLQEVSKYL